MGIYSKDPLNGGMSKSFENLMIDIYAGKTALKTLQDKGFTQDLFTSFLCASGGPKWFTLFGLDKYLFRDFFKDRTEPLNIIGSSAGAFRAACFAQKDQVAALERLAKNYAETVYTGKVTPSTITESAREMLDMVFDRHGVREVMTNPIFKAHFIVARSKGLGASENKLIQAAGMLSSYLLNRVSRKLLTRQFDRYIFQPRDSTFDMVDPYGFKTEKVVFRPENIKQALLASGSIPLVMQGIKNIPDTPNGTYRDGGLIDYHFDFQIQDAGLTLYPHFNSDPKAGWFDKKLSRKVSPDNYDKIVMICPSRKFVEALPYQKIPDRSDFNKMDALPRIKYWKTVLSETEKLSEYFDHFLISGNMTGIKPFP